MSPDSSESRPLLEWLLAQFPDTPRKRAKQWILAGRVTVDGKIVRRPNERLADPADKLQLLDRQAAAVSFEPEWAIHPRLSLLYLDSSLAIVNKGAGLLSVPAPTSQVSAIELIADVLSGKLRPRQRMSLPPAFRKLRPLPVHRLDQYTSGVLCFAMNPKARSHLINQFSEHTTGREYIAYVDGRPGKSRGTWRHWLMLSKDERRQHVVSERDRKSAGQGAVEAITHFEVQREFPARDSRRIVTQLRLRLETGRRHQIRVQAAHEGFPLIGDPIYHPRSHWVSFSRQALHAEFLTLEHPEQPGRRMTWRTDSPADLRELEARLVRLSK
jgi:23S rRNA pseudouridine1911/1915/1917 synthase